MIIINFQAIKPKTLKGNGEKVFNTKRFSTIGAYKNHGNYRYFPDPHNIKVTCTTSYTGMPVSHQDVRK